MLAVALGAQAGDVTDVLDNAWTGISGTSYTAVTDLDGSTSEAVYSVQCAGGNDAIQLRSSSNNSGIVTTTSGGDAKTLKITWNSNTNAARVLQVYGSTKAYSAPTDLYDTTKQGTLIGELGTSDTELDLEGYEYIGIRSKSGALYLDKVELTWTTGGVVIAKPTLTASQSFVDEVEVTITNSNENGTIYYTTDGSDPTASSTAYTGSFTVTETTTVKAIVVTEAGTSSVAEATYTKVEKTDIADVNAAAVGDFLVEGTVTAAGAGGFIVDDGTDYIFVYYGDGSNNFRQGNVVRIIGTTTEYKGTKQFTSAAQITEIGDETVTYPDAGEIDGADLDAFQTASTIDHGYYAFTGELVLSGNYFNISVEGAEVATGALIKPFEDLTDLSGKTVDIEGYSLYVNGKYVYFIATKIEEHVEKFTITMADGVEGGSLEIEPATAAADETVTVTVIPDEGKVLESISANCVNINQNQAVELNEGETPEIYTFLMPADDVVINPVFADAPFEPTELDVTAYQNGWKTDMTGNGVGNYTKDIAMKEHYNGSTTELTGVVLYQDIEDLEPGTYSVTMYANASYTPGRGFNTEALNGDLARVQVFANNIEMTVPVIHQVAVGTNNVLTMNNVIVGDDGKLSIGIRKDWAGSNWHTIQITKLVWESPDQISDPDTYNEYWQGIRDAILAIPEYNNVRAEYTTGNERENLEAAGTGDEVIAAAGPFYHAKTAADAAKALIEREEAYADASATNGMLTDFIVNGTFDESGVTAPWKTTTGAQNQTTANNQSGAFGINNSFFFENWNGEKFIGKMYQEVPGIPNGTYKLSIAAFVNNFAGEGQTDQFVYANEDKTYLTTGTPTAYEVWFVVEDNFAEVGLNQTRATANWMGIDNISLTYFGPGDVIAEAKFADILAEYEECTGQKMKTTISDDLETAKANFDAEQSDANATALKAAVEAAKASIKQYIDNRPAIDAMETLMNSTNVVTEAAYATYHDLWEGYNTAWEEGTLDQIVVNPLAVTGWQHDAGIQSNQYLLSAWTDANGEAVTDYNKALYINTWSTEGVAGANNYNGADFGTPFFEYWTDANHTLGANTWTATLTDVVPGSYTLTALVRVQRQNDVTDEPTGITLTVNDSEPVSVTTGDPTPNNAQFFQGEFTVQGVVGDDGILTVKFDIADDNNISWLSFKDLFVTPTTYTISVPELAGATITTDPEGEAAAGETVTITIDTEEGFDIEIVDVLGETGASVAEVEAGEAPGTYIFTMPAQDVFIDVTLVEIDPNDYTDWIVNADLTDTENKGFEDVDNKTKGIDGSGIVKVGSGSTFDFRQTIENLPAGVYVLTAQAAYRYGGNEQTEYDAINTEGTVTKYAQLYAEVGEDSYQELVMNRWDGASETDYAEGSGSVVVNERYVPNSSAAVQAWFNNGQYVNTVEFTVPEDGNVTIGIRKTESPDAGDYTVIGPWTLYRIGDVPEPAEFTYEYEGAMDAAYEGATITIDIDDILESIGTTTEGSWTVYAEVEGERTTPIRGETNGWRNADGVFTGWSGDGTSGCAFYVQDEDNNYVVGRHPALIGTAGDYTAKLVYVNNETEAEAYVYIHLTYPGAEVIDYTFNDLNVLSEDQVDIQVDLATYYQGKKADVDVAAILEALGVESLDELDIFAVQSDGTLDANYKLGATDGWRDAQGDWKGHGAEAYFYVKADFSAASTQIYEAGTIPETVNTNVDPTAPAIYTAKYAFVVKGSETHDAFVLNVVLNYGDTTGIESLIADKSGEQTIYDLSGRRVRTITKGGMYIVNGKKVFVK